MGNLKKNEAIYWILLAVLGIVLIIFNRSVTNAVSSVLAVVVGIGMILTGAVGIIGWWQMRQDRSASVLAQLVGALLLVGFGIWTVTHPARFLNIINAAAGVILIWTCVQKLMANKGFQNSMTVGVIASVGILLGILIMLSAFNVVRLGVVALGCGLLYAAVVGIFTDAKLG